MSIVVFNYKCKKCNCKFSYTHNTNKEVTVKCPECNNEDVTKIFNILDGQDGPTIGGYYIQHDKAMNKYADISRNQSKQKIENFRNKSKK